jgi:MFS transporter, DHA1 family, inner membrane transport protein
MPRILYLLTLCNLTIGTGAFVINGILGAVSASLNVSVAAAGQAMTVYALTTAVLGPVALLFTGRWPRRAALVLAMALFGLGNVLCALAPTLPALLVGRALMGLGSCFMPMAAGIVVALVEPRQRGRALALVFLGMSLSYVIGMPLGAWLGLEYGWRIPVLGVAGAAALCCAALFRFVPRDVTPPGAALAGALTQLRRPAVLWTLALTLFFFVAIFNVFAYIGPVLQALNRMSSAQLSLALMGFGLAGVAGTLLGGWANDRFGAQTTLTLQMSLLASMMVLVPLTRDQPLFTAVVFLVWGVSGFGMMAPQQSRLAMLAPHAAPLLMSLNSSMVYVGMAFGAVVGGAASATLGLANLAWAGIPFALAGLFTLWINTRNMRGLEASVAAAK